VVAIVGTAFRSAFRHSLACRCGACRAPEHSIMRGVEAVTHVTAIFFAWTATHMLEVVNAQNASCERDSHNR